MSLYTLLQCSEVGICNHMPLEPENLNVDGVLDNGSESSCRPNEDCFNSQSPQIPQNLMMTLNSLFAAIHTSMNRNATKNLDKQQLRSEDCRF